MRESLGWRHAVAHSRSQFVQNAQCDAVRRRKIFGSHRHARNNHRPSLEHFKQGLKALFTPMCPFRRKLVMRRHNALGFSIQLPNFAQNSPGDLESGVYSYLTSINRCTNHCVSIIWVGTFSKIAVKPKNAARLTLTCVAVLSVRLRKPPRQGAASHYDRCGVKGAIRALRVGSSKYSGLWERQ